MRLGKSQGKSERFCGSHSFVFAFNQTPFVQFYVHVTALHRNKFLFNKTNRRTNFTNLFCQETVHVSGTSSAHHQAFSTVHSALVYVMQVLMTAFKHDVLRNSPHSTHRIHTKYIMPHYQDGQIIY
jgi:hypothetical protein